MILDRALPAVSVGDTLHPNAARASHPNAARASRKRAKDDPGDEQVVSRQRSTSRHKEVEEFGDLRSVYLQRKDREAQMRREGKRVEKPIKQRRGKMFCHECKKQQFFEELSCKQCGHGWCINCWVALTD
ncbi:hypothetical protein N656DRAFT_785672 [Canariomyces notabilis]|uniref:Uncharacterized protein n=1 Tax=Canariomyces notabilis TaxID=2074819 RepID=A0AAN6T7Q0_9PEZI|nr:hypothetical protein N656DRAFT_785672 [Canariomyces arenarius]